MRKLLMFVAALLLVVPSSAWSDTPPLKIGAVLPLTGIFGKAGSQIRDAYTLWAEKVNADGGLEIGGKRHKVKLVIYDDSSTPQRAQLLVRKLATKDNVDLMLGGYGSSLVMAASASSEALGYPLISGGASSNKLFERGFKYYFSTLGKATDEVSGAVRVFGVVSPKPKTVAIVGSDIPFTALACQGFKHFAEEMGLQVVHYELFPISLQDYNTMLAKAKDKNPDILLVGSHLQVALRVIRAMQEINFSPKAVAFSYGPTVPAFRQSLGKSAEYVFAASEWLPSLPYKGPVFGTAGQFNDLYMKRFGRAPDYVEAAAVAGAVVQQIAVQDLGLTPPLDGAARKKLMEKLHEMDIETFYGRVHFGADGANVAHPPVCVQIQGGELLGVYPPETAVAKPSYPMPPWGERK